MWERYNYCDIKDGCKRFQFPLKEKFSLRNWGTHSAAKRHPIFTCQFNAVVMANKIISDGNDKCSFSLHSSHSGSDSAAIQLFHTGGWHNQKTILKSFKAPHCLPLKHSLLGISINIWSLVALTYHLLTKH